ncbi:MAG: sulfurtransferase [Gemmatimonadales bacterium]
MAARSFPTPIVSVERLAAELGVVPRQGAAAGPPAGPLVVIDGSWYLPSAGRDPGAEFEAGHVPGAVFWDLDRLSDRSTDLPHMLPRPDELGRMIGDLGIGNDTRVVVYDGSGSNLSAARVWWTLRVAGHDAVAVLDGGLGAWRAAGLPLERGARVPEPRRFSVRFLPELVASQDDVRALLGAPDVALVDARSAGRFTGTEPEPRTGLRRGHVPGAKNLPFGELVGPDGLMLPEAGLRQRFAEAGVDLGGRVIASCGSGVTACTLALALERLGHRSWAIYDGSWAEWGRKGGPPIEQ